MSNLNGRLKRIEERVDPQDPDHFKWAAWLLLLEHGFMGKAFALHDEGKQRHFYELLLYLAEACPQPYLPDEITEPHLRWAWRHTGRHKASERQRYAELHETRPWHFETDSFPVKTLPWLDEVEA